VLKEKGGKAGAHTKSQTRQVRSIKSNYVYKSEKYSFQFFDTPGHGAQDEKNFTKDSTLMAQTVNQLLEKTNTLNGVILVLKMERFRADLEDALKDYIKMFKVFEKKFDLDKKAFMVVITHSLQYNDEVKKAYTDSIFELFKDHVLEENVRHVNFCMIQELHVNFCMMQELPPAFAKLYTEAATRELTEFRRHLTTRFKDAYNIRHWVDRQFGLDKKIDAMFPAKSQKVSHVGKRDCCAACRGFHFAGVILCVSAIDAMFPAFPLNFDKFRAQAGITSRFSGKRLIKTTSGFRWAIGTPELPNGRKSSWSFKVHKISSWILFGIIGNESPSSNGESYSDGSNFAWAGMGQVYIKGQNTQNYGGWTGFQSGDEVKLEYTAGTLTMEVTRALDVERLSPARFVIGNIPRGRYFIHVNLHGNSDDVELLV